MSIIDDKSMFTSMLQDGPLKVEESPPLYHPFSAKAKQWVKTIGSDPLLKTKYRAVRSQVFDFLGIGSYDEIPALIYEEDLHRKAIGRARSLLGNMFGLENDNTIIEHHLREYARTANDVINSLRAKVLAPYSSHIEMTNEIEIMYEPVNLLLVYFDNRYHCKARFEAKRKLILMNLAASIDQRERETAVQHQFADFLSFLNDYVWSPDLKTGELQIHYLHSQHGDDDFSCRKVTVLDQKIAETGKIGPGEKLTLIKRRSFRDNGKNIPIYVTIRKKPPSDKVMKLLRKNQKNPAVAVDDELGLMAVLDSTSDVKRFVRHLTKSAVRANSFMTLEDISDTLTGGTYGGTATGSSNKTPMMKFFSRLGGMRVEFILHTNRSYLNYIYQRDVAHDEYKIKRIFDTGVTEFLFPSDIYHLDMNKIRDSQIRWVRKQIEEY